MLNDLGEKYSKGSIVIHWLTAILILTLFPLGKIMEGMEATEKMGLIKLHAALGISVFILTLVRSILFFKHKRPKDIKTGSKFNDKLAVWIHNTFYFLIIAICISGISVLITGGYGEALSTNSPDSIMERGTIAPLKPHGLMSVLMMLLLVMHIVGVVKHYIVKKENTLRRII
ncbi:MAG: hypothetical protein CL840_18960 [Crocinitomicaceae bacterium]|nr:hypothetical protein [Crocinitomicaceae bacterium]|tara:strand:- start:13848 stop:14366 length:519 start_codon:yes stop_codon:yes gene_type:complete